MSMLLLLIMLRVLQPTLQGYKLRASGVFAAKQSIHEKQEGLRFLHICLASVLNLRSPDESELSGTPLDKLASMLFGTQVTAFTHTCSMHLAFCDQKDMQCLALCPWHIES